MTELSIVPAGAGAGKTHHIQTTLTRWVREGLVRPERILAVTFTEAAAGELRQRIRAALIADGNLDAALSVERAYVSTIHGLGRRLLIEHAFAGGASPQLRLIAEDEQDLLIRRAIEENPALGDLARNLDAYGYRGSFVSDDSAEDSFRAKLLNVIGLLRTLGPRGQDRAMADFVEASIRDGYGAPAPRGETLDAELRAAVGAMLEAFPRGIADGATSAAAQKDFRANFLDLGRASRMLAKGGKDWKLWQKLRGLRKTKRGSPTPEGYDDLADAVMAAADKLAIHPGPLAEAIAHARALVEGAQSAMADYEARKRSLGVIDFSDMVTNAAQLLRSHPAVLGAIMDEVDCVIVDEFQDTNPIQFTFLWTLARQAKRALIVGDTKQAIMGFQGADPRLTTALTQQFETDPLTHNWRSDPRIMEFVNALGPCLFGDAYAPLAPTQAQGEGTALEILQLAQKRSARKGGKPQHFVADRIQTMLGEGVIIKDRHTGLPRALEPRDIAILAPTHNHCAAYAGALRALGLPVRVAEGGWWNSRIVQAAAFALRYAVDPSDVHNGLCIATLGPSAMPLEDALRVVAAGGALEAPELAALGALWPEALAMPVDALLHRVIAAAGLRGWCDHLEDPAQMRADLLRFEAEASAFIEAHRDMREASGFYGQSAHVFLGWLENRIGLKGEDKRPNPSGAEADGIEIVTWHASKGREWPVVVVACLDHKLDPRAGTFTTQFPGFDDLNRVIEDAKLAYAPGFAAPEATERFLAGLRPEADETARRLLYVALTRARNRLVVEWPQDDGAEDEPLPITGRRLMEAHGGLALKANTLTIGGATFPARVYALGADMPPCFEEGAPAAAQASREPRYALRAGVPVAGVAVVSPSLAVETGRAMPVALTTSPIAPGWRVLGEGIAGAAEKGTAVHEALRILLQRPDLAHRVAAHCRLDAEDVEALTAQARGLATALAAKGYPELHVEQVLEIPLADGGTLSAIVDLIAEGPDGYIIVDHKSGPVPDHGLRMAGYWPQLAAYADAVEAAGDKPVRGVAVFWTETGEWSVAG
ncbi:UvrD-helicase domain-containing protein [Novosphingobium humi]|uniref:DNA 3'-5' helicase n=1 Tax=Novosphingobium humi TaxID=2282397 RepID=A0ABY7U7I0_9SPHN|nr:UvrD-helicase domain-containing protein [Novosphingobium humi]WCT80264.1 UvrD-helicase domain-containing protein [Novosphingobium humi]